MNVIAEADRTRGLADPRHRRAARAGDRRGGDGQLRPSGHADGHGRCRRRVCGGAISPRSGRPAWPDRDRFVLSNGHGSMLLYALLHLTGYDLPMDELKRFRQLHPRRRGIRNSASRSGVETTTGPLGQGFANAVGMALAEKTLAAQFNRPGHDDRRPSHLRLRRRRLPDGRHQPRGHLARRPAQARQADRAVRRQRHFHRRHGHRAGSPTTQPARFAAYGWHVLRAVDGHGPGAVDAALAEAKAEADTPTLICCKTVIGRGAPTKQGHQR